VSYPRSDSLTKDLHATARNACDFGAWRHGGDGFQVAAHTRRSKTTEREPLSFIPPESRL